MNDKNKQAPEAEQKAQAPVPVFDLFSLATNTELEVEGIWHPIGKVGTVVAEVKVARWQNDEFQKMMRRLYKANKLTIDQDDDLADEANVEILVKVMARTILKDVRNLSWKGKPVERYTEELGIEIFTEARDVRERVRAFAEEATQFRLNREDETVKS